MLATIAGIRAANQASAVSLFALIARFAWQYAGHPGQSLEGIRGHRLEGIAECEAPDAAAPVVLDGDEFAAVGAESVNRSDDGLIVTGEAFGRVLARSLPEPRRI